MEAKKKSKKNILPKRNFVEIEGKISYDEKWGAWNIIRLKSDFIKEFPDLKEKRSQFSYKIVVFRSNEDAENSLKEIKKQDGSLPIFLFLYKEIPESI